MKLSKYRKNKKIYQTSLRIIKKTCIVKTVPSTLKNIIIDTGNKKKCYR